MSNTPKEAPTNKTEPKKAAPQPPKNKGSSGPGNRHSQSASGKK